MKIALLISSFLVYSFFFPDREYSDNYYLFFENKIEDGFCHFKVPIVKIDQDSLNQLQEKGLIHEGFCKGIFLNGKSSFDFDDAFLIIYNKPYNLAIPLPFNQNTREFVHLSDKGNYLLVSGRYSIYGSGGGRSIGGTVLIRYEPNNDSATVLMKAINYVSEESFGRHGGERFYHSYERKILNVNNELIVLPVDSNKVKELYFEESITKMEAGHYIFRDNEMTLVKNLRFETK